MKRRRLSEVAEIVSGRLVGEDEIVSSAVVDSRIAVPDSLFFAVSGSRADGHTFVGDALARGATAAVVTRHDGTGGPVVVVKDVVAALTSLARIERLGTAAKVVGVTGSTGKTTTKDLAAAVLGSRFRVSASPASFNNEIGLPLTILAADEQTEIIVCELGSRGLGHITRLCETARPDVGVVTNVGIAHMELFGSFENIVDSKAELVECLTEAGTAVLFADDPVVLGYSERTAAKVLTFGRAPGASVKAEDVALSVRGTASFELVFEGTRERVELGVPGEHMVANALAAAATGVVFGVPPARAAQALGDVRVSPWRMEVCRGPGGVVVINDAYNANPMSMAAALKTARWIARRGRMAAVLGAMAELGPVSFEEHEHLGELVARLGVERLITVGDVARPVADAAIREGVEAKNVASYDDPGKALEDVRAWAREGDVVLFKASRIAGLEKLAEAMR